MNSKFIPMKKINAKKKTKIYNSMKLFINLDLKRSQKTKTVTVNKIK